MSAAFTKIPTLQQLIKTKGLPGVEYAIIALQNLGRAQREGWEDLAGGTKIFPIEGPKGTVECALRAKGKPIKGQQGISISRVYVDKGVREATGLVSPAPDPLPESPAEAKSK